MDPMLPTRQVSQSKTGWPFELASVITVVSMSCTVVATLSGAWIDRICDTVDWSCVGLLFLIGVAS